MWGQERGQFNRFSTVSCGWTGARSVACVGVQSLGTAEYKENEMIHDDAGLGSLGLGQGVRDTF